MYNVTFNTDNMKLEFIYCLKSIMWRTVKDDEYDKLLFIYC